MSRTPDAVQDSSVIRRVAAGDHSAREELFRRFSDRFAQLARRMLRAYPRLRQKEETADIVQQAAIRLHRSLEETQPQHVRELFGLASLQIQRVLIDLARHHFGPLGAGAHEHHRGSNSDHDPVAATVEPETLEAWSALHEAIAHLPDEEREAFSAVWYGGATQNEVAELLGVSERTVLRRIHRARLHMAHVLTKHADELRQKS